MGYVAKPAAAATTATTTATTTANKGITITIGKQYTAQEGYAKADNKCKYRSLEGMPCASGGLIDWCTNANKDYECSSLKCKKKDDTAAMIFWIIVCCIIILSIVGCVCCCMCCCKKGETRIVYANAVPQ